MKFDPIRATVSDQTITKVTRLFNGTLKDVLNELLQNARRAGANLVTVGARPDGNGLRITIEDDGCLTWYRSPPPVRRGFCGRCGSSLFYQSANLVNFFITFRTGTKENIFYIIIKGRPRPKGH